MAVASRQIRRHTQNVELFPVGGTQAITVESGADVLAVLSHGTPDRVLATLEGGTDGQVVVLEVDGELPTHGITLVGSDTLALTTSLVLADRSSRLIWRRNGKWRVYGT